MHPSIPLAKQQQAVPVCVCRSSARVGAGTDCVDTPQPCEMDHEGLLKAYMICYRKQVALPRIEWILYDYYFYVSKGGVDLYHGTNLVMEKKKSFPLPGLEPAPWQ